MLLFKAILISVLVVLCLYTTTVYAEYNSSKYVSETKTLFFYVNPHQDKEINLEEKVGKINATSYFDIIDLPKKEILNGRIIFAASLFILTNSRILQIIL